MVTTNSSSGCNAFPSALTGGGVVGRPHCHEHTSVVSVQRWHAVEVYSRNVRDVCGVGSLLMSRGTVARALGSIVIPLAGSWTCGGGVRLPEWQRPTVKVVFVVSGTKSSVRTFYRSCGRVLRELLCGCCCAGVLLLLLLLAGCCSLVAGCWLLVGGVAGCWLLVAGWLCGWLLVAGTGCPPPLCFAGQRTHEISGSLPCH